VRSDRLRLLDALDQIELIQTFAARGRAIFFDDVLVQSAILHRLALLGEACRALGSEIRAAHPEIPWTQIVAFRNIIVHEYFAIDLDLVWTVVETHIDALGFSLRAVLDGL